MNASLLAKLESHRQFGTPMSAALIDEVIAALEKADAELAAVSAAVAKVSA